jgi:hypothetical protein
VSTRSPPCRRPRPPKPPSASDPSGAPPRPRGGSPDDALLAFFRGDGTDDRGRALDAILARDDDWLERTHDFVQWVFPLDARSGANPAAPLATAAVARAFAADPALRARLAAAFARMLAFYGLRDDGARIDKSPAWDARKPNWFVRSTHNDLRITRILRSLALLSLPAESSRLLEALERLRACEPDCGFGPVALRHWRAAATGIAHPP